MSQIVYPKQLPDLIKYTVPHESGFTPEEIVALQNGWRLIKRSMSCHCLNIFMDFFNKNYLLLERFRQNNTGKYNISALHRHPRELLTIYGSLIESGLTNMSYINGLLSDLSQSHKFYGVTNDDVKLHIDYITLYINKCLDKIKSPTFENGLKKLGELIKSYHGTKIEEEDQKSVKEIEVLD